MAQKLSPTILKEAVLAEARVIQRKKEIYSQLKQLNEELSRIDEHGMIGTFGFQKNPNDRVNVSKTGFVNDFQSLSHVARLAAEFEEAEQKEASIQEENEKLRKEVEALKKQIAESEKSDKVK
jgi:regulator of replication initiation timing